MTSLPTHKPAIVIGGGQAGLAMGYHLKKSRTPFLILERNPRVGDSWRNRYDSLILFTPRNFSQLPGMRLIGDPDGYPAKDEMADYLESYASNLNLPIATGIAVSGLTRSGDVFVTSINDGQAITSEVVIIATGAFQTPAVPAIADNFSGDVRQLTLQTYRSPEQFPASRVLVVGDGASGRQIAHELASVNPVTLATGRPRKAIRTHLFGKSIFWWMDVLGITSLPRTSAMGSRMMQSPDPVPGRQYDLAALRKMGVAVVSRLTGVDGRRAEFSDGHSTEVDVVIWTAGYKDKTDWVGIDGARDAQGKFVHERGVSPIPGLFYIGRPWQWTRGSALLCGVGPDAEHVVNQIAKSRMLRKAA